MQKHVFVFYEVIRTLLKIISFYEIIFTIVFKLI